MKDSIPTLILWSETKSFAMQMDHLGSCSPRPNLNFQHMFSIKNTHKDKQAPLKMTPKAVKVLLQVSGLPLKICIISFHCKIKLQVIVQPGVSTLLWLSAISGQNVVQCPFLPHHVNVKV